MRLTNKLVPCMRGMRAVRCGVVGRLHPPITRARGATRHSRTPEPAARGAPRPGERNKLAKLETKMQWHGGARHARSLNERSWLAGCIVEMEMLELMFAVWSRSSVRVVCFAAACSARVVARVKRRGCGCGCGGGRLGGCPSRGCPWRCARPIAGTLRRMGGCRPPPSCAAGRHESRARALSRLQLSSWGIHGARGGGGEGGRTASARERPRGSQRGFGRWGGG